MKLDVPYYSQFLDVEDKEWMPRSCSVVCLKMIFDYNSIDKNLSIDDLKQEGVIIGEYTMDGWSHEVLVRLARNHGLHAYRQEFRSQTINISNNSAKESEHEERLKNEGIEKFVKSLENEELVIVSINKFTLGQEKSHAVLLTGFEKDGEKITGFYYHDPESLDREKAAHLFVDIKTFKKAWKKFAIFVYK